MPITAGCSTFPSDCIQQVRALRSKLLRFRRSLQVDKWPIHILTTIAVAGLQPLAQSLLFPPNIASAQEQQLGQEIEMEGLGRVGPIERIKEGFQFTEGPAKTPDGSIYFTDIPAESILRLTPDGELESFLTPSGSANGLMYGGSGQLLACQMDGRLVSIDLASKQLTVLADAYQGQRFNACNDLVIDKQGGIYFTDPRYKAPEPWPQGTEAFYYRSPAGEVVRLGASLLAPNGIALSPDESTLYVVPSMQSQIMAFKVMSPGVVDEGRVLCELAQVEANTIRGGDGLAVDSLGNLYITSSAGVQIVTPAGQLLGILKVPEEPANCAFGGVDNKTLYITARTGLYRCTMPVEGHIPRKE